MLSRRGFLGGLAGILAAGVAPAIVHNPMKVVVPKQDLVLPNVGRGLASSFIHLDEAPIQVGLGNVDNLPRDPITFTWTEASPFSKEQTDFIREWVQHLKKDAAQQNDERLLARTRQRSPQPRRAFA